MTYSSLAKTPGAAFYLSVLQGLSRNDRLRFRRDDAVTALSPVDRFVWKGLPTRISWYPSPGVPCFFFSRRSPLATGRARVWYEGHHTCPERLRKKPVVHCLPCGGRDFDCWMSGVVWSVEEDMVPPQTKKRRRDGGKIASLSGKRGEPRPCQPVYNNICLSCKARNQS